MNINSYYNSNISTLFQSMYNTGSSSSSSMASLTTTVLGGSSSSSGIYSSLSDYNLIKSGSYSKLLKAYYSTMDTEDSTSTSSTDIFEKLKSDLAAETKKAESTVTETEDGKVVEKTEASDATKDTDATETDKTTDTAETTETATKKASSVLEDLLTRNRTMYTSTGSVVKQTDSLVDYAV